MADRSDVQSLFLQVDASVELLRRNLATGEQPLSRFEQRASKMAQSVEKSIGDMGSRFGAFAQMAESAATKAQRSFEESFSSIQKMAAQAVTTPSTNGAALNLGAADARQVAEQARQQAQALAIIEQAARRAAAGEGEMTRETRLYLQAAQAARIEGEQRARSLMAEAGALERLEMETLAAARAMGVMDVHQTRAVVSTGQMRAAQQQLTYNLGDAITMWGMGAQPMQIFISQASQVTGAIGLMSNSSKGFIGFIGGPWMQIILGAATILGVLIAKSGDTSTALDQVKFASDGLQSAQGILGRVMDLTTLKIRNQRTELVALAEAQLQVARIQSQRRQQEARSAITGYSSGAPTGITGGIGGGLSLSYNNGALRSIAGDVLAGKLDGKTAIQRLTNLQKAGAIDDETFGGAASAIANLAAEKLNEKMADSALRVLDGKGNSTDREIFRQPGPKGPKGPSAETLARRAEAAQNAILSDQIAYAQQERQARKRLLDAQGKSAATEEERDRLAREEIDADYQAEKTRIAAQNQKTKGGLSEVETARLNDLNEQTRKQRLDNIKIERAREKILAGYEAEAQSLASKIAMKRIEGDMATTLAERRKVALELLALEQEQRRQALKRVMDDPNSSAPEVQRAKDAIGRLPAQEAAERGQVSQQNLGPMEEYRQRLLGVTGDMNTALEQVKVNGLEGLEDDLLAIITGTESVGSAFKRMAASIISDLARIYIQKLILGAIGGLAGGGKVEGRAGGGKISGPGTGTSDSILAMVGSKPIMLSNGESIVTADATRKFWPIIDAMNKGQLKGLAGGGKVNPSLSAPRLPSFAGSMGNGPMKQSFHYDFRGALIDRDVYADMQAMADRARDEGAEMGSRKGVQAAVDLNDRNYGRVFGGRMR